MHLEISDIKAKHPIYRLWYAIKSRCYNASNHNYPFYQGKGIIICDEWLNNREIFFEWCIKNGWKQGLSLDRIDSNKDYSPDNCQFITISDNSKKAQMGFHRLYGSRARKNIEKGKRFSVYEIIEMKKYIFSGLRLKDIAKMFNTDPSFVSKVKLNKRWKSIEAKIEVNINNLAAQ